MDLIDTPNPYAKKIETDLFENAVYELIYHYQKNKQIDEELSTYQKYLINLYNSPQFLNSYAWRMTELNQNLDDALDKVNLSLSLLNQDDLIKDLKEIKGVSSVFFGPNFITITKEETIEWESINQDIINIFDKL